MYLLVVDLHPCTEDLMGHKRSREEAMGDGKHDKADQPASPYMSMFEGFRAELDTHHERRERIIKASRDITAASKKMYGIKLKFQ